MKNQPIEGLSAQNYQEKPRSMSQVIGEKAALKIVDPKDLFDMKRFKEIYALQTKFMDAPEMTDQELVDWAADRSKKIEGLVFGIGGANGVKESEVGELQGWVYMYPDEPDRVKRLQTNDEHGPKPILPETKKGQRVIEVSYAKHPQAEGGQVSSALRQACLEFSKLDAAAQARKQDQLDKQFEERLNQKKTQGLTLEQEIVLRQQHEDAKMERGNAPTTVVTAYVNPDNQASYKVLEAAGFKRVGGTIYDTDVPLEEREGVDVFVLDWDKLHEIEQNKAAGALFSDSKSVQK